ncbi:glycoside hydrolase family 35 protein [Punctularia strigosozonata HHB-11173 SS5]|uniref:glycoside hydrolase family 35 protein n=1 Tax=Punctularia strigosozonata (strain HHB-11173) TaxID=741275 RepID=UPI0004416840|nr:glycoside hydrolase family 35 protein [Punctularia strigosozonata HHB-11173 SS5]EIN12193.1 glycoside hydrolase family 35 protein [Punctularia strigosozonata HHB-11173 SS5]
MQMLRPFCILYGLLALACAVPARLTPPSRFNHPRDFINTTGLTNEVGWDKYSFFVNGSRVFIQSGEFHQWRLPVPGLWTDVLQKYKAAGLNTISIYTHWAMINPKQGEIDLKGINDLQALLDAAREAGLFVIARPGPYINAETTGGGVPGHVLTLPNHNTWFTYNGEMRSNDTLYHNAWKDYVNALGRIIADNQVTNGGPVIMVQIENEYYNGPGINEYFDQLADTFRGLGVVVPTMDNDPGMYRNLVDSTNIYGFDAYPLSFDCSNPTRWRDIPTTWRSYHESVTPDEPFMIPEFQGGSFLKWASNQTYAGCHQLTNPNFQRVFYHQLWASGVTAENFYMVYGGTNWGQLPYPAAITSYDYSAAISETRELNDKYGELKLQSMFLRSFPDFRKTNLVVEDNTTHTGIDVTHLQNPDTGAAWFISRHVNVSDWDDKSISLDVGNVTVPQLGGQVAIPGRDSVITSTNLSFGKHSLLAYSTASLFTQLVLDNTDVLVAYGSVGRTYEVALAWDSKPSASIHGTTTPKTAYRQGTFILNYVQKQGITSIQLTQGGQSTLLLLVDYAAATQLWLPTVASSTGPLKNYADLGASTPVLISGPYLVRNATIEHGTISLWGDLNATTTLTVLAPSSVNAVVWNGETVRGVQKNYWGALQARLHGPKQTWSIPDLAKVTWRYADSLPEIQTDFDDSTLVGADHTSTTNPFPPYYGGPWILYGSDYGFHAGNLLWRGTFEHSDDLPVPTAVNVSISGGINFAASIWLNDVYLGPSDNLTMTNNESFPVTRDMLRNGSNYVTVLQDHMGYNLAGMVVCCTPGGRQFDIQMPRGIQGYYLEGRDEGNQFTGWKVAGNLGGEDYPDKTRKILNEGGLYGERMGWHLPGFDDSHWTKRTPWQGISKPGVGWFRATFTLSIPAGHDVPLAFVFSSNVGHYRAQLYVNGWQLGKRVANLGPQTFFPVHEGILNYDGENTVAVSLWALGDQTQDLKIPSLELVQNGVYSGGPGRVATENTGWSELR